jgi:hypothetical protein
VAWQARAKRYETRLRCLRCDELYRDDDPKPRSVTLGERHTYKCTGVMPELGVATMQAPSLESKPRRSTACLPWPIGYGRDITACQQTGVGRPADVELACKTTTSGETATRARRAIKRAKIYDEASYESRYGDAWPRGRTFPDRERPEITARPRKGQPRALIDPYVIDQVDWGDWKDPADAVDDLSDRNWIRALRLKVPPINTMKWPRGKPERIPRRVWGPKAGGREPKEREFTKRELALYHEFLKHSVGDGRVAWRDPNRFRAEVEANYAERLRRNAPDDMRTRIRRSIWTVSKRWQKA